MNNALAGVNVGNPAGKPDDGTAPMITNLSVSGGPSETITFTAVARDNDRVSRVLFYVDGVFMGYGAPRQGAQDGGVWTFPLDSTLVSNGQHKATARAFDGYNNVGSSMDITFNTCNKVLRPIQNGGFEQDLASWNKNNCEVASKATNIHSGVKAAWMAGYGSTGKGSIHQVFEIPQSTTQASVS